MEVGDGGVLKPLSPQAAAAAAATAAARQTTDTFAGTSVFVLFDTSNFMYRGFVYAEDAIGDFIRGLDKADSVAVYTFSRNLSRAAELTQRSPECDQRPANGGGRRRYRAL